MNTNTLLSLYQSYALTKVSELNKQSLIALYAQNEQLNKLNQELAKANRATETILRNQIKEIERQEKRRYFKSVTFNLSQAMTLLEEEENVNFRIFSSNFFISPIRDMAQNAIQELDEIADKEYAQNIIKRSNELSNLNKSYIENYENSSWASLLSVKSEIEDFVNKNIKTKQKEIQVLSDKKNEALIEIVKKQRNEENVEGCLKACIIISITILIIALVGTIITHDYKATLGAIYLLVPALLVLFVYYKKGKGSKNKKASNKNDDWNDLGIFENEIQSISNNLTNLQQEKIRLTTRYNDLLQEITAVCPTWEDKLKEIAALLPHEENVAHRDPLLLEVANCLVKEGVASTTLIQRKFSVGYKRAGRILNQLEEYGIVGPDMGSRGRELRCGSEEEISEILNPKTIGYSAWNS